MLDNLPQAISLDADARLAELQATLLRQDAIIAGIEGEELPPGRTPASGEQEERLADANDERDEIVVEITTLPARA